MKIMVATASKHGATTEVGDRIAEILVANGDTVVRNDMKSVTDLRSVDAVVCGSGIYMGSWTKDAQRFIERFADDLTRVKCWAFSCGPIGDPLRPVERPEGADAVVARVGATNQVFPGRVVKAELSVPERLTLAMVKAPEGDFRDWADIDRWARDISRSLKGNR